MQWRASVDRVVEGLAILIPEGRPATRLAIPSALLPPGIKDGAVLLCCFDLDSEAEEGARREIARLQQELAERGGS